MEDPTAGMRKSKRQSKEKADDDEDDDVQEVHSE